MNWLDALIDRMYDAVPTAGFGPFSLWGSLFNVVVSGILVVAFVWMSVTQSWLLLLGAVGGAGLVVVFVRIYVRSRRGDFVPKD